MGTLTLFYSYSHQDAPLRADLDKALALLKRQGLLSTWSDEQIDPGAEWRSEITRHLETAEVILLLVSPDFLASDFCWGVELELAMQRQQEGEATVIPVILRPCDWESAPFGKLKALPDDGRPVSEWTTTDAAWRSVAQGLRRVIAAVPAGVTGPQARSRKKRQVDPARALPDVEATDAEYGEALELIKQILRSYAPQLAKEFPFDRKAVTAEVTKEVAFRLMPARAIIFGHSGVGKTTIVNQLLEKDIFPASGELTCTRSLAAAQHKAGLVFYDSPGIGDEPLPENITRVALGLDQLDEEQVQSIPLLDLTEGHEEGPSKFRKLTWKEIAEGLQGNLSGIKPHDIAGKDFRLADFQDWLARNPFNFAVFVMSSEKGLEHSDGKLIQEFYLQHGATGNKFFKILNVFRGGYRSKVDALADGVKKRLMQAQERLSRAGVDDYEDWVILDAKTGEGLGSFVHAFAESLSVEVLASLSLVLNKKYSHLVEDKIDEYYCDYLGHIASLIAVFPVDQSEGSKELLAVALDSLVGLAGLMAPDRKVQESKRLVDDVIRKVKQGGLRGVYESSKNYRWDILPRSWSEALGLYDITSEKVYDYYGVGGINSVKLVLPLGMTIRRVIRGELTGMDAAWAECVSKTDAKLQTVSTDIHRITRKAGKGSKDKRIELAEELYPHLRKVLR